MTWRSGLTWWSPWAAVTSAPPSRGSGTSTGICRIWRDGRWQKYGPRATTSSIASRSWLDSWTGRRARSPGLEAAPVQPVPGRVLAAQLAFDLGGAVDVLQAVLLAFGRAHLPGRRVIVRVLDGGSESPGLGWHHALLLTEHQWAAILRLGENSCLLAHPTRNAEERRHHNDHDDIPAKHVDGGVGQRHRGLILRLPHRGLQTSGHRCRAERARTGGGAPGRAPAGPAGLRRRPRRCHRWRASPPRRGGCSPAGSG